MAGILNRPIPFVLFIVVSVIIKVVAGGKRRAELTASQASQRAETEQLERTVLEARMEALQAQIEPHFLFNTLASIDQLIQTDPVRASRMISHLMPNRAAAAAVWRTWFDWMAPWVTRVSASLARASPTSSTPFRAGTRRVRSSSATASWTTSDSAALHTDGRCVFALTTMSSAISRSADAST